MNAGLVARLVVLLLALSEAFLVKSTALPWSVCDAATLQPKHVAGMECTARISRHVTDIAPFPGIPGGAWGYRPFCSESFLATNDIFNFTARSKLLCCPKQEKSRSGAKPSKFRPPQP